MFQENYILLGILGKMQIQKKKFLFHYLLDSSLVKIFELTQSLAVPRFNN